jgi:hypothetical protein
MRLRGWSGKNVDEAASEPAGFARQKNLADEGAALEITAQARLSTRVAPRDGRHLFSHSP